MDALDMLSGDEDDSDCEDAEPAAKLQKVEAAPIDFNALCKANKEYGSAMAADDDAEAEAAAASLRGICSALQRDSEEKAEKGDKAEKTVAPVVEPAANPVASCERPPDDGVEIWDEWLEEGGKEPVPWSTWDAAQAGGMPAEVLAPMRKSFNTPMPIQAAAWPIICSGRDLIGVAKTGSGKTLAYLLPCLGILSREGATKRAKDRKAERKRSLAILQRSGARPSSDEPEGDATSPPEPEQDAEQYSPAILVLAPSRELVCQIEKEAERFQGVSGVTTALCYGGSSRSEQLGVLRTRPGCVVATVGRLVDYLDTESHWFNTDGVRFMILDEADRMIDEGCDKGIRSITHGEVPGLRQTMMFSATFSDHVSIMASWILKKAIEIRVGSKDPLKANTDIDQKVMLVKDQLDKEGALKSIFREHFNPRTKEPGKVLIFCASGDSVDATAGKLKKSYHSMYIERLHGNRKQHEREIAIAAFKSGKAQVLVATNVAGRGLDVKGVKLVVNFDPPEDPADYLHRIGRTGRAGQKGTTIALLLKSSDGNAMSYIAQVMRRTGLDVPPELAAALKQRRGRYALEDDF